MPKTADRARAGYARGAGAGPPLDPLIEVLKARGVGSVDNRRAGENLRRCSDTLDPEPREYT
jgi:hypothetical protein